MNLQPRPAHIANMEAAHAEPVRQPLQRTGGGGRKDPTGHASPSR
jgi:hypothetical protein